MNTLLIVSNLALWVTVLALGFLLLGTLRSMGLLTWRLEQIEATRPSRIGREGLKVGRQAPDFTLSSVAGHDISLHDFAGRKLLLVFTQSGCGPCHDIVPELNRIYDKGDHQVLVVNNGEGDDARQWAIETKARFPVLLQQKHSVAKRFEVFATPFAFLIDEHGVIASKGIAGSAQYLGYVLSGADNRCKKTHEKSEIASTVERDPAETRSPREVTHA